MATKTQDSAVLIINDTESAVDILQIILQFSRVFSKHPIRVLRGDRAQDRDIILSFTKRYKIASSPSLITRDNTVIVGRAKICEFIPRLAKAINTVDPRASATHSIPVDEESFREHQLAMLEEMDQAGVEGDDSEEATDYGKRRDQYLQEMKSRGAQILQGDAPEPRRTAPSATCCAPKTRAPSRAAQLACDGIPSGQGPASRAQPQRAPVAATRAPQPSTVRASSDTEGQFESRFQEMFEESPQ